MSFAAVQLVMQQHCFYGYSCGQRYTISPWAHMVNPWIVRLSRWNHGSNCFIVDTIADLTVQYFLGQFKYWCALLEPWYIHTSLLNIFCTYRRWANINMTIHLLWSQNVLKKFRHAYFMIKFLSCVLFSFCTVHPIIKHTLSQSRQGFGC